MDVVMDRATASRDRTGNWVTRGLVATGRGAVLTGLTLAALGLWAVLVVAVAFAPLGIGLRVIPGTLQAIRRLANTVRRRSADWCGVPIAIPYLPEPAIRDERRPGEPSSGFWQRFLALLADQATWRDLLWTIVNILVGWVLTLAPVGMLAWGLYGVITPAVWHPIVTAGGNNWYAFIHVTDATAAWQSLPLGLAIGALGLWAAPRLLRGYGAFAHSMLAPARRAEPAGVPA